MLIRSKQPVTIQIIYYRPDYTTLLQEFVWSYEDLIPELERTHKFLWHWKRNIQAVIREINLGVNQRHYASYASVDAILRMN
jgi:uncharacterized protein Usg